MISTSRIQYNKWTFITLTKSGDLVKLYVHGILDLVYYLTDFAQPNQGNFYVGNTPSEVDECSVPAYYDDIRIYNKVL